MTRVRFLAPLAALMCLGALAGGFATWLPESARAIIAIVTVLAAPAALLAGLTRPPDSASTSRLIHFPFSLLVWLSLLSLWTSAFVAAGVSFRTYAMASTWVLLGGYLVTVLRNMRQPRRALGWSASKGALALVAVCVLVAVLIPHRLGIGEDGLDHVGYVRHVLTENDLQPAGVLAAPVSSAALPADPRKGTVHDLVALASWVSNTDPAVVWRWLPVLMFPVAMCAAIAFNSVFLRSRGTVVAALLLVMLTFDRNPLRFADASAHGETLAATFAWALAAAVLAGVWRSRWVLWTATAAGGVLVHLGVSLHIAVLAGTVGLVGNAWGIERRDRFRIAAGMLGGVALGLAMRYPDLGGTANIIHSHTQGVLFLSKRWFVASPFELLRQQGLVFLGGLVCVPFLALLARRRDDARAIVAASLVPFVVAFVPWIATALYERGSYMVFRSLLQVPAMAAIAVTGATLAAGVRGRRRAAWWIGVPAALLWIAVFIRPVPGAVVGDVRARIHEAGLTRSPAVSQQLIDVVAGLPAGSVILSDPATSYVLSAYTSQRFVAVYQQHGNPRDPFALDRIQAVRDVLSPYVMPSVAVEACRRYGVNYVVVNGDPPRDGSHFLSVWKPAAYPVTLRRMLSMGDSFARVDSVAHACVYRFEPAAPVDRAWEAQDQPVVVASPVLSPCGIDSPNGAFQVTGLNVDPERVLPGDTIQVTVGYQRDAPGPYRMPVLMHLRFDHEDLDNTREFPGEKQWRRARAGRSGERSRFRVDVYPGHGSYDPDLWPAGVDLCETFAVVVPPAARTGTYRVELSLAYDTQVPNFHVRDLLFNRDHYSGMNCGSLQVVDRMTEPGS